MLKDVSFIVTGIVASISIGGKKALGEENSLGVSFYAFGSYQVCSEYKYERTDFILHRPHQSRADSGDVAADNMDLPVCTQILDGNDILYGAWFIWLGGFTGLQCGVQRFGRYDYRASNGQDYPDVLSYDWIKYRELSGESGIWLCVQLD